MAKSAAPAFTASEIAELETQFGRFCDLNAVIEITGLSERTIGRLVDRGEITRYRPGGARSYRYKTREVARLLKAC